MRVLSLFDGISCARVAFDRAGIPVTTYYASEVDPHAIAISTRHYPDIIRLGDVREVTSLPEPIDVMIGGSPCQDLSIAKKDRQGLEGSRSSLFWEYVRLWQSLRPRWFLFENVASMPKADRDLITKTFGVEPILIDAALVSAQTRKRLFWTNLPVSHPADRGILLRDILLPDAEVDPSFTVNGKSYCLTASYHKVGTGEAEVQHNRDKKQRTMVFLVQDIGRRLDERGVRHDGDTSYPITRQLEVRDGSKSKTLTSVMKDNLILDDTRIRKLTPVECERLQGLPDGYTDGVAKTHRYKALGNAFNVDVIAHILQSMTL